MSLHCKNILSILHGPCRQKMGKAWYMVLEKQGSLYIGSTPMVLKSIPVVIEGSNKTERGFESTATHRENNSDRGVFPCQKPQKGGYGNVGDFTIHI